VELCAEKLPTYFINSEDKILSAQTIMHYDFHTHTELVTESYLPKKEQVSILLTSCASCPDALVEGVIKKIVDFFPGALPFSELVTRFTEAAGK
jgi:4-hydroxy-3-methylbut-2-en-1-yl diphosphate reductase